MSSRSGRQPSQRQLRVGELLRHALSEMLTRGDIREPALEKTVVTVLEVSVSPDLKQAKAFVMPLGGLNQDEVLDALRRSKKFIRGQLSRAVNLKYAPDISFQIDTSFENSAKIDKLLHEAGVARDLSDSDGEPE